MARKYSIIAIVLLVAAPPVMAAQSDPAPMGAPAAPATARYCLRVAPITGTRLESVACETRETWAMFDVDVDQAWAEDGVRVVA